MPLRRSHKTALTAIGVIAGWISLSVVSNQKEIRLLYCRADQESMDPGFCETMRCEYKYYFFVPFSKYLSEKGIGGYVPMRWCIESMIDNANK